MLEWEGNCSQLFTLPSFTMFRFLSGFEAPQQGSDAWIAVTYPKIKESMCCKQLPRDRIAIHFFFSHFKWLGTTEDRDPNLFSPSLGHTPCWGKALVRQLA